MTCGNPYVRHFAKFPDFWKHNVGNPGVLIIAVDSIYLLPSYVIALPKILSQWDAVPVAMPSLFMVDAYRFMRN